MEEIRKCSWTLDDAMHQADMGIGDVKNGFVKVGFSLKYIRDEKLWKERYSSFDEFMDDNYAKDKSWASRCINLYDQFGAVISPGDVPRLDERYVDYNISQLIEMLSMPAEQRTQITPEMKVKEIREMKPKRKKPEPEKVATVATPDQQEPEPEIIVPEPPADEIVVDTSTCPPDNGRSRSQEWGTSPKEQEAEIPPELNEEPTVPVTEEMVALEDEDPEELSEDVPNLCPEEIEPGDVEQPQPEAEEQLESVQGEEEPLTDMQIAREELERAKKLLNDCLKVMPDENDHHIRRMKMKVVALACYVCELDNIENPPPVPVQPELPLLKNNDQRVAFVDAYENWPLWTETKETGERYYRYDLEDGTSLVVKVYHAKLFDYKTVGLIYEERFIEGYGRHEYYLLEPGKYFRNCETNRSELVEKLKEIQKAKKG